MSIHPLRWYPQQAPRKKLRGKRAYFRSLKDRASRFELDVREGAWWDLWHYHADGCGWGNLGWSYRRPHVEALCDVYRRIALQGNRLATPFQAWILISGEDASQDATYLHTPNPNGTPFPMVPTSVEADATALGPFFSSRLPELRLRFGWSGARYDDDGIERWSTTHWIWADGVGCALWAG